MCSMTNKFLLILTGRISDYSNYNYSEAVARGKRETIATYILVEIKSETKKRNSRFA